MALFTVSSYHDYIDLQNVSGSGDPASAPDGDPHLLRAARRPLVIAMPQQREWDIYFAESSVWRKGRVV